jgi:hypothetical protein
MYLRNISLILLLCLTFGCAGKVQYFPPETRPVLNNTITLNKSKEEVWKYLIPMLGKQFFVINNLDKGSGIINISYSGDPENYVDCGRIHSYVKNARGERTYNFPGASQNQTYEIMDMETGSGLLFINRKMNLEGRMNIIVEVINDNQTTLTVNTKYILTKTVTATSVNNRIPYTQTDTISFNSGQRNFFPSPNPKSQTACQPTGKLEEDVISLLHGLQI